MESIMSTTKEKFTLVHMLNSSHTLTCGHAMDVKCRNDKSVGSRSCASAHGCFGCVNVLMPMISS